MSVSMHFHFLSVVWRPSLSDVFYKMYSMLEKLAITKFFVLKSPSFNEVHSVSKYFDTSSLNLETTTREELVNCIDSSRPPCLDFQTFNFLNIFHFVQCRWNATVVLNRFLSRRQRRRILKIKGLSFEKSSRLSGVLNGKLFKSVQTVLVIKAF